MRLLSLAGTTMGLLLLPFCAKGQKPDHQPTHFPLTKTLDYVWSPQQARVAYPAADGSARVWIKSDSTAAWYWLETPDSARLTGYQHLTPPNYTNVVTLPLMTATVYIHFTADTVAPSPYSSLAVQPMTGPQLHDTGKPFTVFTYGCFEPFEVGAHHQGQPIGGPFGNQNVLLRETFRQAAFSAPLAASLVEEIRKHYSPALEVRAHREFTTEQVSDSFACQQLEASLRLSTRDSAYTYRTLTRLVELRLPPPRLFIGTGDQVYLDTDYDNHSRHHPLTGWTFARRQPLPRWGANGTLQFTQHVARTYAHYGSFTPLQSAFSLAPSLLVWDDHDIRDGWGSQLDEYSPPTSDALNPNHGLAAAYRAARRGYLDHQYALGPAVSHGGTYPDTAPLYQIFEVGGKPGFAFDLRSQRNSLRHRVIGHDQKAAFEAWVAALVGNPTNRDREVLIVSSIPLFKEYRAGSRKSLDKLSRGEADDDNRDGWDRDDNGNSAQRDSLVGQLVKLRQAGLRPILLSGDIHEGAITEVWYSCDASCDAQVLAYELISSGLSHASLKSVLGDH